MAELEPYRESHRIGMAFAGNPILSNWSSNVFFFIAISFLIYVIAVGDATNWKRVLSGKITSTTVTTAGSNTSAASTFGR